MEKAYITSLEVLGKIGHGLKQWVGSVLDELQCDCVQANWPIHGELCILFRLALYTDKNQCNRVIKIITCVSIHFLIFPYVIKKVEFSS